MLHEKSAYLVGNFTITNSLLMKEYLAQAGPLVQKFGGKMVLSTDALKPLEGSAQPVFVIIQFPDMEKASSFYQSEEYAPVKQLRIEATTGGFLTLIDGQPAHN